MAKTGRRSGRTIIIVALILIIVLLGATYVYIQLRPASEPATEPQQAQIQIEEMVDIVITTQAVPRGEVITENVVAMIPFPKEELVEGTFITNLDQVIGKKAKYPLEARMPLTPSILIDAVSGSIAAFDLPVDKTALSIPIDRDSVVAYALQPGDHVMVIGCMLMVDVDPEYQTILPNLTSTTSLLEQDTFLPDSSLTLNITSGEGESAQGRTELDTTLNQPTYIVPSEPQRPRLVCQNVIQDAIVMRVGDFPISGAETSAPQPQPTPETQNANGEEIAVQAPTEDELKAKLDIVTLAVYPQDAVLLNYMQKANIDITLALRNPNNTQEILTDAVTQQYLMDQKNIPLPAKLPFAVEPRIGELANPGQTNTGGQQ